MVNGVQLDPAGPDEKSDPFQLAVPDIVLENDIVGEVDAPDRLQGGCSLAGDWKVAALAVSFDSQGLGHGASIVLHPGVLLQKNLQKL